MMNFESRSHDVSTWVDNIQKQVQQLTTTLGQLNEENRALRHQNAGLEVQMKRQRSESSRLSELHRRASIENGELRQQLATRLSTKHDSMLRVMNVADAQQSKLVEHQSRRINSLEAELEQRTALIKALELKLVRTEGALQHQLGEMQELKQRAAQTNEQGAAMDVAAARRASEERQHLAAEILKLQGELQQRTAGAESLTRRNRELEGECTRLINETAAAQRTAQTQTQTRTRTRARAAESSDNVEQTARVQAEHIAQLTRLCQQRESELLAARSNNQRVVETVEHQERQIQQLSTMIESLQEAKQQEPSEGEGERERQMEMEMELQVRYEETLRKSEEERDGRIEQLSGQLEESRAVVEQGRREIEAVRREGDAQLERLGGQLRDATANAESVRQQYEELQTHFVKQRALLEANARRVVRRTPAAASAQRSDETTDTDKNDSNVNSGHGSDDDEQVRPSPSPHCPTTPISGRIEAFLDSHFDDDSTGFDFGSIDRQIYKHADGNPLESTNVLELSLALEESELRCEKLMAELRNNQEIVQELERSLAKTAEPVTSQTQQEASTEQTDEKSRTLQLGSRVVVLQRQNSLLQSKLDAAERQNKDFQTQLRRLGVREIKASSEQENLRSGPQIRS